MTEFFKVFGELATRCAVKVLKLNLSDDTYRIIHSTKGEYKSKSPFLKDWIKECCDKELIHPDYAEGLIHLTDLDFLNKTFKYKDYIHFKFKRCSYQGCEYRNNVLTILPVRDDNPLKYCYVVVYDIDE